MDWDDLNYVAALAEAGSVRRAGARLGVHGATVARRVERLEAQLRIRLFARTRRGMEITAAGQRVLEVQQRCAALLTGLADELLAEGAAVSGTVVLHLPSGLALGWILPRFAGFAERYPEVRVALELDDAGQTELVPGAAAAVLRVTANPPDQLVGRRLGPLALCAYQAKGWVGPEASEAPQTGWLVGPPPASAGLWQSGASGAGASLGARVDCADVATQAQAAAAGLGIAVLPCVLGDSWPGLERVRPAMPVVGADVWLLSHPDSRGIARLQALLGYLLEIWREDAARLGGRPVPG